MTNRLDWKTILAHNPELLQLGDEEQANINHVGCPAGADRKKRLYVRKRNGTLIGYCHHCQSKGAKGGQRNHIRNRRPNMLHFDLKLPRDFTTSPIEMHPAGRAWLRKYLTPAEIVANEFGWSQERGRVILPVRWDTKLVAYQSRHVLGAVDKGPKYMTDKDRSVKHPVFLRTEAKHPMYCDHIMLVEDILSAVVVNRVGPSCALLGVHLDDVTLHALIGMGFRKFVIALDDDNAEVKRQQRAMMKKIHQFAAVKLVTGYGKDPKEWDNATIERAFQ